MGWRPLTAQKSTRGTAHFSHLNLPASRAGVKGHCGFFTAVYRRLHTFRSEFHRVCRAANLTSRSELNKVQLAGFAIDFAGQIRVPGLELARMQLLQQLYVAALVDHDFELRVDQPSRGGRGFGQAFAFCGGGFAVAIKRGELGSGGGASCDQKAPGLLPLLQRFFEAGFDVAQLGIKPVQLALLELTGCGANP